MFSEDVDRPSPPPGLAEFERAMVEAASTGADAWIATKAGEVFAGEVQRVRASVVDSDLFGREVTVTINNRDLSFQEISHWTVGLTGEPSDEQLDAAITQALDHFGPLSVVDLVVQLAQPPLPTWCTVPRARGRLELLETERWVRRIGDRGDERWQFSRRRTADGWVPE